MASAMEIPGMVEGMYSTTPSSSGGINSVPIRGQTGMVTAAANRRPAKTSPLRRKANFDHRRVAPDHAQSSDDDAIRERRRGQPIRKP